jgi:hypothetical protein
MRCLGPPNLAHSLTMPLSELKAIGYLETALASIPLIFGLHTPTTARSTVLSPLATSSPLYLGHVCPVSLVLLIQTIGMVTRRPI